MNKLQAPPLVMSRHGAVLRVGWAPTWKGHPVLRGGLCPPHPAGSLPWLQMLGGVGWACWWAFAPAEVSSCLSLPQWCLSSVSSVADSFLSPLSLSITPFSHPS